MAVTYTDNLHLGMQLDKNDYLDWDAITDNWRKIDEACAGGSSSNTAGVALPISQGDMRYIIGVAEEGGSV